MSMSQEPTAEWCKPGGTMLLTLDLWTSRVIECGTDSTLGQWSYMEFVRKQNKRVVVVSGYRIGNQKFDAALNTTTAQQIRLLQQQGHVNPNPRNDFLTNLIQLINQWHMAQKEVIVCIDTNKPIDDPKSKVSHLFTETDLVNLHHH